MLHDSCYLLLMWSCCCCCNKHYSISIYNKHKHALQQNDTLIVVRPLINDKHEYSIRYSRIKDCMHYGTIAYLYMCKLSCRLKMVPQAIIHQQFGSLCCLFINFYLVRAEKRANGCWQRRLHLTFSAMSWLSACSLTIDLALALSHYNVRFECHELKKKIERKNIKCILCIFAHIQMVLKIYEKLYCRFRCMQFPYASKIWRKKRSRFKSLKTENQLSIGMSNCMLRNENNQDAWRPQKRSSALSEARTYVSRYTIIQIMRVEFAVVFPFLRLFLEQVWIATTFSNIYPID